MSAWIGTLFGQIIAWLRGHAVLVMLALVLGFTAIVVDPFRKPPRDPNADDLAAEWSESIARLGITPVFPPEEDLYVGDLWAVISDAAKAGPGVSATAKSPLLGKAVRLGHLDLRDLMLADTVGRPVFADTAELKTGDEFRHQDDTEAAPPAVSNLIRATIAAFPGVSISHVKRASSAGGSGLFGFGASRDDTTTEELRIPVAETYGVRASAAAGRLILWCGMPENKLLCTDAFARRLLAFTLGNDVMARDPADQSFVVRLELQLITRVFMTRTIEQRRFQQGSRGAHLSNGSPPAAPPPGGDKTATPEAQARDAVSATQSSVAASAKDGVPSMEVANGDLSEIRLQQTFQRPVVFGFRSWNVQLDPTGSSRP